MAATTAARDPALYFFRQDVRKILMKLTGFDLKKIYAKGFNPGRRNAEIQLLTQKQLEAVRAHDSYSNFHPKFFTLKHNSNKTKGK